MVKSDGYVVGVKNQIQAYTMIYKWYDHRVWIRLWEQIIYGYVLFTLIGGAGSTYTAQIGDPEGWKEDVGWGDRWK